MRRTISLGVTLLAISLVGRSASADPKACIAASEKGQSLRNEGKLGSARVALTECANDACPAAIRKECSTWLGEVDAATPTVVFGAKNGTKDVVAVRVSIDGTRMVDSLDGRPMNVDPGSHVFHFETEGQPPIDKTVLIKQGEKNRSIDVAWGLVPTGTPTANGGLFEQGSAMVTLQVEGGDPVLEKKHSGVWSPVCTGACNRPVALDGLYRLNGSGVSTTAPFTIDAKDGEKVTLSVEPGTNHGKTPGLILIGTGAGVAGVGLILTIVGALTPSETPGSGGGGHTPSPLVVVGPIVGGVGVVLLVSGLILLATGRSDVRQTKALAAHLTADGFAF